MWSGKEWMVGFTLIAMIAHALPAGACSYGFDNNVFPVSDHDILKAPAMDFENELKRFGVAFRPPMTDAPNPADAEADSRELTEALRAARVETGERERIVGEYSLLRYWMRCDREKGLARPYPNRDVPDGLPAEFDLYVRGAIAFEREELDEARAFWTRLLELPEAERRYRTVWAAYMIGRSYATGEVEGDAASTIEWMRRTRELAAKGLADSQKLAEATWGWEARAELGEGRFERAFELYCKAGDLRSLADAAQAAFRSNRARFDRLARDPLSVKVMTACAASGGGPWRPELKEEAVGAWLAALERSGVTDVSGADAIAWAAYQHGRFDTARRWLAQADRRSNLARWLESKLLLRDGKVTEATAILTELVAAWPVNDEWHPEWILPTFPADRLVGELGTLKVARGQFVEAMDMFLRSLFFEDAAYVAERVLTVGELKDYVDRNWPAGSAGPVSEKSVPEGNGFRQGRGNPAAQVPAEIRYLLARRLTRLGRWREAGPYFPANVRPLLDAYVADIRGGHDPVLSRDERGESLWRAAQTARRQGMELMGTEMDPDFRSNGGRYGSWDRRDTVPDRVQTASANPMTGPGLDETRRAFAHHPTPDRRLHYRYVAAEHAWAAAQLLPDESDLKATVLCDAGNWIAPYDAAGADRFYKSLVRDCGTTRLGRIARRTGWLP